MKFNIGDIVKYKEGPDTTHYRVTGFYDLFGGTAVSLVSGNDEHVEFQEKLELVSSTFGRQSCGLKKSDVVISPAIKNWLATLPIKS